MMGFAGSVDTNVLLRLLLRDIPEQHKAALELVQKADGQLVVADVAIIEMVFVLHKGYSFTRKQIVQALEGLSSAAQLSCNAVVFERIIPEYLTHPKLSFEDCYLAALATHCEAEPVWTFDKKLANQIESARLV